MVCTSELLGKYQYLSDRLKILYHRNQNFGGLKGAITFRKIQGIVNVHFQIYRSSDSAPITGDAFISIANIYSDIGYIPNQIALLHSENSTQYFPALLENYAIQIPQTSLNAMSTSYYYTYGEVQGYSNWRKPLFAIENSYKEFDKNGKRDYIKIGISKTKKTTLEKNAKKKHHPNQLNHRIS